MTVKFLDIRDIDLVMKQEQTIVMILNSKSGIKEQLLY